MFGAVDAGRPDRALTRDHTAIDPVFDLVQRNVFARAEQQRVSTTKMLIHLHALQRSLIATSIVLAILTLSCFFVDTAVLNVYKRRLQEAHRQELDQLAKAARTDNLTGVGNHRAYKAEIERQIARAVRHGEDLALALLDIDEMTLINDQNGHVFGDRVLVALGALLAGLRAENRAFRLGGDEFANVTVGRNTQCRHRSLLRCLKRRRGASRASRCGVVFGKARRSKCVRAFDANVDEMWLLSPSRVRQLRDLIADEAVSIAFQPIWEIANCTILAYAALARPAPGYGFADRRTRSIWPNASATRTRSMRCACVPS